MSSTQKILISLGNQINTDFIEYENVFESEGDRIALSSNIGKIANTKLLLTFEDKEDASTDFSDLDLSDSQHIITGVATAQIDTAYYQDGSNSLLLDGNSDYIYMADHTDWDFGSGDFCVEMYTRPSASKSYHGLMVIGTSTYSIIGYMQHVDSSGKIVFYLRKSDDSIISLYGDTAQTLNAQQHIAIFRDANTVYLAKDGTIIGSADVTGVTLKNPAGNFLVGTESFSNWFQGNIDMVRVVKGDPVYSSGGFTAPTTFTYSLTSPSPAAIWTALPVGAVVDISTAKCWMFKDGIIQAATNTDVKFKYAINNGALSSSTTLAALRLESDPTITDAVNSFKAVGVYASDGTYESKSSAWLEVDVVLPEGGGKYDKFGKYGHRRIGA